MKIAMLALAAPMLMAAPAMAQTPTWVSWGTQNGETLSYDSASVSWSKQVVTATVKAQFSPPVPTTNAQGASVQVATMLESISVDCAAGLYIDNRNAGYDASGAMVVQSPTPGPAKAITPGGGAAAMQAQFCKK
ncbi:surface-adhesin E family protein [Phenylobacterium aquaticum]|jgi:hypothetical protein|uniref:surface-adhesin E family protein n=1 Tax=Phenylobacterium aquaticum TaxID=1763816 RepID=UPI001F5DA567|nr:surface-adhesin E family protein [Phenylobacterium aquaticum]MCI3134898.1 hypothetical protein [Phenylobacterium aquaticum]